MKFDYCLAVWFSKTKDKIIPGTAFLFLNKVTFVIVALVLYFVEFFSINISVFFLTVFSMTIVAIIMYGFQKRAEQFIRKSNLEKEYLKLSKSTIMSRRLLGLSFMFICYMLIFIVLL